MPTKLEEESLEVAKTPNAYVVKFSFQDRKRKRIRKALNRGNIRTTPKKKKSIKERETKDLE